MKLSQKVIAIHEDEDLDTTKLGIISQNAYNKVHALDKGFIGTKDYMGLAFFWSHAYRHSLRDCTAVQRQKVHAEFLKQKLELTGESDKHEEIIGSIIKK